MCEQSDTTDERKYIAVYPSKLGYMCDDSAFIQGDEYQEPDTFIQERAKIVDIGLFDRVRSQGYVVFPFKRGDQTIAKFDRIFYKYNVKEQVGMFLFYKHTMGHATIAALHIPHLTYNLIKTLTVSNTILLFVRALPIAQIRKEFKTDVGESDRVIRIGYSSSKFEPYNDNYSISSHFKSSLTISGNEGCDFKCSFCQLKAVLKDSTSGDKYCSKLCQFIMYTTKAPIYSNM
jgi:hypothetical protein